MATDLSFVEYIAEQSRLESSLTWKKMFGEYALYLGGKVVAFACDNSLFIKASPETAALTAALPGRPPYPGAKDYPVADELLDEPDHLRALLLATERAMPLPKVKGAAKRVTASKAVKKAPAMKAPAKNAAAQKTASKTTPAKKPASTKTATRKRPVR